MLSAVRPASGTRPATRSPRSRTLLAARVRRCVERGTSRVPHRRILSDELEGRQESMRSALCGDPGECDASNGSTRALCVRAFARCWRIRDTAAINIPTTRAPLRSSLANAALLYAAS